MLNETVARQHWAYLIHVFRSGFFLCLNLFLYFIHKVYNRKLFRVLITVSVCSFCIFALPSIHPWFFLVSVWLSKRFIRWFYLRCVSSFHFLIMLLNLLQNVMILLLHIVFFYSYILFFLAGNWVWYSLLLLLLLIHFFILFKLVSFSL